MTAGRHVVGAWQDPRLNGAITFGMNAIVIEGD
jgi:hypothetical protein